MQQDDAKRLAAEKAVEYIGDARVVGLGTGTTTRFAIERMAQLIREGADFCGVPTSNATAELAHRLSIPLRELTEVDSIDISIDGADEIDPSFNMIKGGGGALTREKLVALASKQRIIIADQSKMVEVLGQTRPLPVEVLPFAWNRSAWLIEQLGCRVTRRDVSGRPFVTDNGNYIVDCKFESIPDPPAMETRIKLIPGVVECGLFIDIADTVIIGLEDSVEIRVRLSSEC